MENYCFVFVSLFSTLVDEQNVIMQGFFPTYVAHISATCGGTFQY